MGSDDCGVDTVSMSLELMERCEALGWVGAGEEPVKSGFLACARNDNFLFEKIV